MERDSNFSSTLRQEMGKIQDRRHTYRLRKLSFVAALFGLGSVGLGEANFAPVLYLIPVVAFAFDIHILTADYSVKRVGGFLSQETSGAKATERDWEAWVQSHPNPMGPYTSPLITLIVLVGAAIVLWMDNASPLLFWTWIVVNLILNIGLVIYWARLRKRFAEKATLYPVSQEDTL